MKEEGGRDKGEETNEGYSQLLLRIIKEVGGIKLALGPEGRIGLLEKNGSGGRRGEGGGEGEGVDRKEFILIVF